MTNKNMTNKNMLSCNQEVTKLSQNTFWSSYQQKSNNKKNFLIIPNPRKGKYILLGSI